MEAILSYLGLCFAIYYYFAWQNSEQQWKRVGSVVAGLLVLISTLGLAALFGAYQCERVRNSVDNAEYVLFFGGVVLMMVVSAFLRWRIKEKQWLLISAVTVISVVCSASFFASSICRAI
jgi:formate-dependent nitrite reductase membrane component NrfD